jgi:hypothetical protein
VLASTRGEHRSGTTIAGKAGDALPREHCDLSGRVANEDLVPTGVCDNQAAVFLDRKSGG